MLVTRRRQLMMRADFPQSCLTKACLQVPSHPVPVGNTCMLPCHRTRQSACRPILTQQARERGGLTSSSVPSIWRKLPYLLCFALPSLLAFVWPSGAKSSFSGLHHARQRWVLLRVFFNLSLDGRDDSPATLGCVGQMFYQGVIAGLPAVETLLAEKACAVVGVVRARVEVESCFCELQALRLAGWNLAAEPAIRYVRSQV